MSIFSRKPDEDEYSGGQPGPGGRDPRDWGFDDPAPPTTPIGSDLDRLVGELRNAVDSGLTQHLSSTRDELLKAVRFEATAAQGRIAAELDAARADIRAGASTELDRNLKYLREDFDTKALQLEERSRISAADQAKTAVGERIQAAEHELAVRTSEILRAAEARIEESAGARINRLGEMMRNEGEVRVQDELRRLREEHQTVAAELRRFSERAIESIAEAEKRVSGKISTTSQRLERSERRQELKLVKQEQSRRIDAAVEKLELRGAEIERRLADMLQAGQGLAGPVDPGLVAKTDEVENRVEQLEDKLYETREWLEDSIRQAAEAEQRIEGHVRQAEQVEQRIDGHVRQAEQVEQRIDGRIRQTEEAGQRIEEQIKQVEQVEQRIDSGVRWATETEKRIESEARKSAEVERRIETEILRATEAAERAAAAERRTLTAQARAEAATASAERSAAKAQRAAEAERRSGYAADAEAEAARRIEAAERTIRDLMLNAN